MTVYHVYMALDSKLEIVRWTRYVSAQIARSTNDGPLRTAQTANRRFMQACKFFYLVLFISITGFMFYGCMFTIKNTHLVYSLGFSFKGSRCKKNHCVFFQFDKFVSADFLWYEDWKKELLKLEDSYACLEHQSLSQNIKYAQKLNAFANSNAESNYKFFKYWPNLFVLLGIFSDISHCNYLIIDSLVIVGIVVSY